MRERKSELRNYTVWEGVEVLGFGCHETKPVEYSQVGVVIQNLNYMGYRTETQDLQPHRYRCQTMNSPTTTIATSSSSNSTTKPSSIWSPTLPRLQCPQPPSSADHDTSVGNGSLPFFSLSSGRCF